ncbi:MAG: hypothetical protein U0165_08990 [Polyangiaceae bacterium]
MLDQELLYNSDHQALIRLAAHLKVKLPSKLKRIDTHETHKQLVKRVLRGLREVGALS